MLILAGEHSGDEHAARLMNDFLALRPEATVVAVGGEELKEAGAHLLFDLVEHSVIGFFEVVKHYRFFKALFDSLIGWIDAHRPQAILFVDYPGFNLRLAHELHKRGISHKGGGPIGLYYYIAPQVWAWKAKRRFKMAEILDGLAVILPFEVETFADTTLPTRFVGHPFTADGFVLPLSYEPSAPVLLLPGSRVQQVSKVFPLQLAAFRELLKERPETHACVIYPSEKILRVLKDILASFPEAQHQTQFKLNSEHVTGSAVLMSSGTMSLAVALSGMPGVIVQRVKRLTYLIGRMLVKIDYIGLANIILNRPLIPEYIQKVDTMLLCQEMKACLDDGERRSNAQAGAEELRALLTVEGTHPGGAWLAEALEDGEQ